MLALETLVRGAVQHEAPFLFGDRGLQIAPSFEPSDRLVAASTERISSGVEPLDEMLGGGYFHGSSTLITGAPGTAKSTLCGAFVEAALERGIPCLYVTFDIGGEELVRNLASVDIRLGRFLEEGLLACSSRSSSPRTSAPALGSVSRPCS